jgi:hypothetical protein
MNLIFAIVWLAVSLVIFALPWLDPNGRPLSILGGNVSAGFFSLLLCLYNLARWWSARVAAAAREAARQTLPRKRAAESERHPRPYQAPDPTFNFTDEPPRDR